MSSYDQESDHLTIGKSLKKKVNARSLFGIIMTGISAACIIITLIPLFAVFSYVLIQGFSRVNLDLFVKLPQIGRAHV